jgi:hypothetical protein
MIFSVSEESRALIEPELGANLRLHVNSEGDCCGFPQHHISRLYTLLLVIYLTVALHCSEYRKFDVIAKGTFHLVEFV